MYLYIIFVINIFEGSLHLCAAPEAVLVLGAASVDDAPEAEGEDAGTAGVRPAHRVAARPLITPHPGPLEYYEEGQWVVDHVNTISLFQILHCKMSGDKSTLEHFRHPGGQYPCIHVSTCPHKYS